MRYGGSGFEGAYSSYAASPLVNCKREDDPNLLVSYGDYDAARWKTAYDAVKRFIDLNNANSWYELRPGQKTTLQRPKVGGLGSIMRLCMMLLRIKNLYFAIFFE